MVTFRGCAGGSLGTTLPLHNTISYSKFVPSQFYFKIAIIEIKIQLLTRLKQRIQEGPGVGQYKACIKFAEVQEMLRERYPGDEITTCQVVTLLQLAFPHATTERTTYITGIRRRPASMVSLVPSPTIPSIQLSQSAISPLTVHSG